MNKNANTNDLNIERKGDVFFVHVNPKVFSIEVIYSAAYVYLDKAFIVLDGDINQDIVVKIKPKTGFDGEILAMEFHNELIKYSEYKTRFENGKELRQMILQRALITGDPEYINQNLPANKSGDSDNEEEADDDLLDLDDADFLDDPEGIAIPWEEKYGKKDAVKNNNTKKVTTKKNKSKKGKSGKK